MLREAALARTIAETATPLIGAPDDLDPLLDRIGDARFVLLGEATHGSHDFYRIRAELTKRLIREKGFRAIATEGDWPDWTRVDRFVRGRGGDAAAIDALDDVRRFPAWMWRNADVLDLVGWLRDHDDHVGDPADRVACYGLDLYSLHGSMQAVLDYLDSRDPQAARRARDRYACLDAIGPDPRLYGYRIALGLAPACQAEVLSQLCDLIAQRAHPRCEDAEFVAEQNARVVANAEAYYRAMYAGQVSTWNLRDTHMIDTLDAIAGHLECAGRPAKIVVWAHNSHVGDSSAMSHRIDRDELTLGRLCRERHPGETVLVGFTTDHGTVTAASSWDGDAERKQLRPALAGSYEALFHHTGVPKFLLMMGGDDELTTTLREPRLERAIGVVYRPDTERASHYFEARLADQLDAVIHIDDTRAVDPLERGALWDRGELPETYPTGL